MVRIQAFFLKRLPTRGCVCEYAHVKIHMNLQEDAYTHTRFKKVERTPKLAGCEPANKNVFNLSANESKRHRFTGKSTPFAFVSSN